jgi:hypothetical protein
MFPRDACRIGIASSVVSLTVSSTASRQCALRLRRSAKLTLLTNVPVIYKCINHSSELSFDLNCLTSKSLLHSANRKLVSRGSTTDHSMVFRVVCANRQMRYTKQIWSGIGSVGRKRTLNSRLAVLHATSAFCRKI